MNSIISKHFSDFSGRPLLILFIIVIFADLLYVSFTKNSFSIAETKITLTGPIREKAYDDEGNIKSITVGNVLCYVNHVSDLHIGSLVSLTGTSHNFSAPMNLGGFNAKSYYKARKIDFYINADSVTVLSYKQNLRDIFASISHSVSNTVSSYCTFEAGTINTLLLGDKSGLSEDRKLSYKMAGVSHFLVISGLHISAIGAFIYSSFRRILKKRTPACIISIMFLFTYGILVGFSVSVIRALIMFTVRLFSYVFKRTYDQLSAVSLAGTVTLIIYPYMLTDSSFIYSYVTVFVISFYMIFFKPDKRKTLRAKAYNLLSMPVIISIFVMPVTLYFSGTYSFLSILCNILLVPFSAPILLTSALAMILSVINFSAGAKLFDFLLHLMLKALDILFGSASFSHIFSLNGRPPVYMIVLFYIMMIAWLIISPRLSRSVIYRFFLMFPIIIISFCTFIRSSKITMLYVGQGECLVIKTGTNSAIISDCGSASDNNLLKYTIFPYLNAAGICRIDALFISHPDADHTNYVAELLAESSDYGIEIIKVFVPEYYIHNDAIQIILSSAKENKFPVYAISKGYKEKFHNLTIECLSRDANNITGDTNNDSLVFKASYNNLSILLTGDISSESEKELIKENIDTDVLKVPHHGSRYSCCEEFISAVSPKISILSAGKNNRYNHPHSETIMRLLNSNSKTYATRDYGEIDIYTDIFGTKCTTYVN